MNIIDYILKEAKVNKWSVLQENQIKNMTDQFLAKNKIKEDTMDAIKRFTKFFVFEKIVSNYDDAKQEFYNLAEFFNKEVIKKLNLQPSEEKRLLIWLLEQWQNNDILNHRLKEDIEIIKQNLELYFKNKKEIHKDIYSSDYSKLKEYVHPYMELDFIKHQEFLSKPIAQGKEYKIYKVTDIDTCIKIGQNTSWCIQGEEYAKDYLSKGPLYLVTKNDHRFALLSFETEQFMDVNDNRLDISVVKDIFSAWPESEKMLDVKKNADLIKYIDNPSEAVQLEAIQNDAHSIQFIENPSEVVQLKSVQLDQSAIKYIKNPAKSVLEFIKK
jgi:hypothetical protein